MLAEGKRPSLICWDEPSYLNEELKLTRAYTPEEVLKYYWKYWSGEMLRVGKSPMITENNCLIDFIIVNWAWEVE